MIADLLTKGLLAKVHHDRIGVISLKDIQFYWEFTILDALIIHNFFNYFSL